MIVLMYKPSSSEDFSAHLSEWSKEEVVRLVADEVMLVPMIINE
jgi:hypothetical protein